MSDSSINILPTINHQNQHTKLYNSAYNNRGTHCQSNFSTSLLPPENNS